MRDRATGLPFELSASEYATAELASQGHANKEIGFRLGLTEGTVKGYMSRVFQSTGFENRTALAMGWEEAKREWAKIKEKR